MQRPACSFDDQRPAAQRGSTLLCIPVNVSKSKGSIYCIVEGVYSKHQSPRKSPGRIMDAVTGGGHPGCDALTVQGDYVEFFYFSYFIRQVVELD